MKFSPSMIVMALVFLGLEPKEGDASAQLDNALNDYDLDKDKFFTEPTIFAMGYHRGLSGAPFDDNCLPVGDDDKPLTVATEWICDAYTIALEAREAAAVPPPSMVYAAFKAGKIKPGAFAAWLATVDLKSGHRLNQAVTVGSGSAARTIPAGTPVDILSETVKDGVPHVIVMFDGLPLIIPNPTDAPRVVSADTAVAAPAKERKARKVKEGGATTTTAKTPTERMPSLRDAIIHVLEGKDGGTGPLASNGVIAGRVKARCTELGIGDKAVTFVQKADKHVPYYCNIYGPEFDDATNKPKTAGRLGVEKPLISVCLQCRARKYYNRGDGLTHEQRMAQIPKEVMAAIEAAGDQTYDVPKATTETPAVVETPAE